MKRLKELLNEFPRTQVVNSEKSGIVDYIEYDVVGIDGSSFKKGIASPTEAYSIGYKIKKQDVHVEIIKSMHDKNENSRWKMGCIKAP